MYLLECYDGEGELVSWQLGDNYLNLEQTANTMSDLAGVQSEVWSVHMVDDIPNKTNLELIIPLEF